MWQFLIKAAISSIIMKAKPIKKMVKRFMRGAVKKLGKTAGTLIGGAALMILGGYVTNGAFGFAKGFFGGAGAASQAKSAFDLIGRAKDAFSTAGSEMSSFTEFLKGGVDKVTGNAETGTDLGTGFDQVDPDIGPPEFVGPPEVIDEVGNVIGGPAKSNLLDPITVEATKRGPLEYFYDEAGNIIGSKPKPYNPMLGLDQGDMGPPVPPIEEVITTATQEMGPPSPPMGPPITPEQAALKAAAAVPPPAPETPWYKKPEAWMEKNPKTTALLTAGIGLLSDQGTPAYQQSPMMMGVGGYTGYGTSQTDAWRAYSPEYVAYSVDNQLNPNSYVNYMSALG